MILTHGSNSLKWEGSHQNEVEIGGRLYPYVQIGNQLWLAENLDYKFSYNGNQLPIGGSGTPNTPAAWYYNNDEATYGIDGTYKCGLLYNWYAAKYLDDNKATLLPSGWHVPTLSEWLNLASFVGNSDSATKMKAIDGSVDEFFPSDWQGTDNYKLGILPTGYRTNLGTFVQIGTFISLWTTTPKDSENACRVDFASSPIMGNYYALFSYGYSIRLVKDS